MNIREGKITFSSFGAKPNPDPCTMNLCETFASFTNQLFLLDPKACPFYSSEALFIVGFFPHSAVNLPQISSSFYSRFPKLFPQPIPLSLGLYFLLDFLLPFTLMKKKPPYSVAMFSPSKSFAVCFLFYPDFRLSPSPLAAASPLSIYMGISNP